MFFTFYLFNTSFQRESSSFKAATPLPCNSRHSPKGLIRPFQHRILAGCARTDRKR